MEFIYSLDFLKDVFSIIASIAAVVAVIYAIRGIDNWKKQFKAKRKLDIAEDALALFDEVRDVFKYIRRPYIGSNEINNSEKDKVKEQIKCAYITFERFNLKKDFFQKLGKLKYKYKIYFGEENLKPFNEIENIINDLLRSSDMLGYLISLENKDFRTKEEKFDDYMKQKKLKEITNEYDEYDEINKRIDEAIKQVERFCLEIIKKFP